MKHRERRGASVLSCTFNKLYVDQPHPARGEVLVCTSIKLEENEAADVKMSYFLSL